MRFTRRAARSSCSSGMSDGFRTISLQPGGGKPVAPSAIRAKSKTYLIRADGADEFAETSEPRALARTKCPGSSTTFAAPRKLRSRLPASTAWRSTAPTAICSTSSCAREQSSHGRLRRLDREPLAVPVRRGRRGDRRRRRRPKRHPTLRPSRLPTTPPTPILSPCSTRSLAGLGAAASPISISSRVLPAGNAISGKVTSLRLCVIQGSLSQRRRHGSLAGQQRLRQGACGNRCGRRPCGPRGVRQAIHRQSRSGEPAQGQRRAEYT